MNMESEIFSIETFLKNIDIDLEDNVRQNLKSIFCINL